MKHSAAEIRWDAPRIPGQSDLGLPMLNCEFQTVYTGQDDIRLGAYSHHPHLSFFRGVVYLAWSVHYRDEDSPGQYVRMIVSRDLGKTWSDPYADSAILFPKPSASLRNPDIKDQNGVPQPGHRPHDRCGTGNQSENSWKNDNCGHSHLMLCSNGWAEADGRLYAVAELAKVVNKGIARIAREVCADGTLGPVFYLNREIPELRAIDPDAANLDVFNAVGYGGETAEKIVRYLADPFHLPQWDMLPDGWPLPDGTSERSVSREFAARSGKGCGEPTYAYRAADGTLVRLWRDGSGWQNAQLSEDGGATWTRVEKTSFPDCASRTNVGNLPDGRVYLIGNPGVDRRQLCLALSRDGFRFDDCRCICTDALPAKFTGRAKNYGYQYPHSVLVGDRLIAAFSRNKEDLCVASVKLADL